MSAVKVIRALLIADLPLSALVGSQQIVAGIIGQGTQLPALAITEVNTVDIPRINAQSPFGVAQATIQVTIVAASYPEQKNLLDLVRKACNHKRGIIAGVTVVSVTRIKNGPDFNAQEVGFYMQSIDFSVVYEEPN